MRCTPRQHRSRPHEGAVDKVTIVAGAAPGNIGGATAVRLAEEGMPVSVADLDASAAHRVAADLSRHTAVGRDGDVLTAPLEVWQHTTDVTLTGYVYGIRQALPIMIAGGRRVDRHPLRLDHRSPGDIRPVPQNR